MPPPKSTAGFTKSAQKVKYVRNRDLKLSGKELKEESRIQHGMTEGICIKCREKVQWRFQFNKYKPLKNIANCSDCHKKCITKAYRTLCDECAHNRNVCPGCCQDIQSVLEERKQRNQYLGINEEEEKKQDRQEKVGVSSEVGDGDMGGDMEEGEEEDEEGEEGGGGGKEGNIEPGEKRSIEADVPTTIFTGTLSDWNSRKFDDVVATKYSKARVTGSNDDQNLTGTVVESIVTSSSGPHLIPPPTSTPSTSTAPSEETMIVVSDDIPS